MNVLGEARHLKVLLTTVKEDQISLLKFLKVKHRTRLGMCLVSIGGTAGFSKRGGKGQLGLRS